MLDNLNGHAALDDDTSMEGKLFKDTQRVVSLAFSNLDGAESVRKWFARNGSRDYEPEIYRTLGQVYLNQERFRDAAETFDMYVNAYPDSELAPEFSSLQIDSYQKGASPLWSCQPRKNTFSTMASPATTGTATRTFANSMLIC